MVTLLVKTDESLRKISLTFEMYAMNKWLSIYYSSNSKLKRGSIFAINEDLNSWKPNWKQCLKVWGCVI